MKNKWRKLLALTLSLSMVMGMLTVGAFAAQEEEEENRPLARAICAHWDVLHAKSTWETVSTTPATCTEYAIEHQVCTQCGDTRDEKDIWGGKASHTWSTGDDIHVTTNPTCLAIGTGYHYCTVCGTNNLPDVVSIPALGHNFVITHDAIDWGSIGEYDTDVRHTVKCTRCGLPETRLHNFAPATCTERETCACGKKKLGSEPLGHEWATQWSWDETDHWHDCTRTGCDAENDKAAHSYTYGAWSDWTDCTDTAHAGQQEKTRTGTCACGKAVVETEYQAKPTTPDPDPVAVTGVILNKVTTSLEEEATETLVATVVPDNATNKNVTWSSDNTAVATVDENGEVTAVAAGTAIITVTTEDGGHTAACTVTVTAKTVAPEPCRHENLTAVDNKDETHKVLCADCREEIEGRGTEAHTFENGVCTVCNAKAVAQVISTGRQFTTLQAAVNAAGNGDTVEVLKDCAGAFLTTAKSITLNIPDGITVTGRSYALLVQNEGAELTITGEGTLQGVTYGVVAQKKGVLKVNSGKIQGGKFGIYLATGASATVGGTAEISRTTDDDSGFTIGVYGPGGDITADSTIQPTTLTVNGGTITNTKNAAIGGNGSVPTNGDTTDYRNTKITISGGTITSAESLGIYHPQVGEMTITGGTITGITGIEMRVGTLNVSGDAVITGTSTEYSHNPNNSGATTIGVGIALSQHVTELPLTAVISGGTITGYHAVVEHDLENDPQSEHVTLTVEGGTFTATGEDNVTVISDNFDQFITGGYFSNDVTDTDKAEYLADAYASHLVNLPGGYYHVHVPAYDEGVVTKEPTYTEEGERTFTCQGDENNCTHHYTEPIPVRTGGGGGGTTTYYTLTINYVDGEGNAVATRYNREHVSGYSYSVTSPTVEGMTADQTVVSGRLTRSTTVNVVYTANEPEEEINEPDTPLTENPGTATEEDLTDPDTPLAETPDEEELSDGETPLAEAPQTGDSLMLWVVLALLSALGMGWLAAGKKRTVR